MYSILKEEDLDESTEEESFNEYVTADSKAPKEVVYNENIHRNSSIALSSMNVTGLFIMFGNKY